MQVRNTRPGYVVEGAEQLDDSFDHGLGLSADGRVRIDEEHEMYAGEEGEVQAVVGLGDGQYAVDVLIDGTESAHRFDPEDIAEML